jgi:hypothetical protein
MLERQESGKRTKLTARGVKQILTRAGVDHTDLDITERGGSVQITGPREARTAATHALWERQLWCAPYPDKDLWSR